MFPPAKVDRSEALTAQDCGLDAFHLKVAQYFECAKTGSVPDDEVLRSGLTPAALAKFCATVCSSKLHDKTEAAEKSKQEENGKKTAEDKSQEGTNSSDSKGGC